MKNSTNLNSAKGSTINQRKKRISYAKNNLTKSSDVLVSAVISPYLLTYLHQILQQAEFNAKKDSRLSHAANCAKLRKVLCLDARSMEDASASEFRESGNDIYIDKNNQQNVA